MGVTSPTGIVRVYRKEPVIMYTSPPDTRSMTAVASARAYFEDHLEDRLLPEDVELQTEIVEDGKVIARVIASVPVLKAEFKNHDGAREWLSRQPQWNHCDVEIVLKNSKRDHEIRTLGVKRRL